jgi:hypothetical protein
MPVISCAVSYLQTDSRSSPKHLLLFLLLTSCSQSHNHSAMARTIRPSDLQTTEDMDFTNLDLALDPALMGEGVFHSSSAPSNINSLNTIDSYLQPATDFESLYSFSNIDGISLPTHSMPTTSTSTSIPSTSMQMTTLPPITSMSPMTSMPMTHHDTHFYHAQQQNLADFAAISRFDPMAPHHAYDLQQSLPWHQSNFDFRSTISMPSSVPITTAPVAATATYQRAPVSPSALSFPGGQPMSRDNSNRSNDSKASRSSDTTAGSPSEGKPCRYCHKYFKDIKAHESGHAEERPFKCRVPSCEWYHRGFARAHDSRRHSMQVHWKTGLGCPFCKMPHDKVDMFRKHLISHHNVKPRQKSKKKGSHSPIPDQTDGNRLYKCGVCQLNIVTSPQMLHDHIEDCILEHVKKLSPTEAINEMHLSSVESDPDVLKSIERNTTTITASGRKKHAADSRPKDWGKKADDMTVKRRKTVTYDGTHRLHTDDMAMRENLEVKLPISLPDGSTSEVSDLDMYTMRRTEGMHSATVEERGPPPEHLHDSFFTDMNDYQSEHHLIDILRGTIYS